VRTLVVIAVAVALLLGVLVGAVIVTGDDDDPPAAADEEGEVFLEPVSSATDPFTDSVAAPLPPAASTTTTSAPQRSGTNAVQSVQGSRPGLYGGTRSETSCDRGQLVRFLRDNPDRGRAWASVLDIDFDDIQTYVDSLTPVLLRGDTRVTNHGYRDGRATVIQSVLQSGTAVLVDHYGEPIVRCYCGNPLRRPTALRRVSYTGSRWDGFSASSLTVIQRTTVVIQQLVLVDWRTGQPFARPVGTDGSGDLDAPLNSGSTTTTSSTTTAPPLAPVPDPLPPAPDPAPPPAPDPAPPPAPAGSDLQVTLSWATTDDLDLSVTEPGGGTVSLSGGTASGGNLDQDANRGCSGGTSPLETASWPDGAAPPGSYSVSVNYYAACGDGAPVTFTVTATSGGAVVASVTETVTVGEQKVVATFTL
jgi:hypothetical protein